MTRSPHSIYGHVHTPAELRAAKAKARYANQRRQAIELFGGICARCGIDDHRVFQFDHIENDGFMDKELPKYALYKRILDSPERFQLLCANCHQIKTHYPEDF